MSSLLPLLRANRPFYLSYAVLLLAVGGLQLRFSQTELMQWVNAHTSPAADLFFTYATYLGDGAFFALVILALLLRSYRWAIKSLLAFLLTTLVAQGLKRLVFADHPRPAKFFAENALPFRPVEGVELAYYHSFPSGHSTSAFALFCLLALIVKNKRWGYAFALLAALTAYSRVYLFQHFVQDVYVGSLIGVVVSTLIFSVLQHYWTQKPKAWLDRRLLG
jgi:membrane-associated phospholipid phosphatase